MPQHNPHPPWSSPAVFDPISNRFIEGEYDRWQNPAIQFAKFENFFLACLSCANIGCFFRAEVVRPKPEAVGDRWTSAQGVHP